MPFSVARSVKCGQRAGKIKPIGLNYWEQPQIQVSTELLLLEACVPLYETGVRPPCLRIRTKKTATGKVTGLRRSCFKKT